MKRTIYTLLFCMMATMAISAQTKDADKIIGTYFTAGNKGKVSIEKYGNKFNGTLIWTHTQGAKDKNNPQESERMKPLAGKVILKDFVYSGHDAWEKGTIYDPESGKTYSCKITRKSNGDLKVRGFIGISLLGRTTEWKHIQKP